MGLARAGVLCMILALHLLCKSNTRDVDLIPLVLFYKPLYRRSTSPLPESASRDAALFPVVSYVC